MLMRRAALVAVALLGAVACIQFALACGLPFAQLGWGGRFDGVLPQPYRWASLGVIGILGLMSWVALARADIIAPGSGSRAVRGCAWGLAVYLGLNTVVDALSPSIAERLLMTPIGLALMVCLLYEASGPVDGIPPWRISL